MTPAPPVVVLAGGTGGAKLARGLADHLGERLVVLANTGDDVEIHGGHVSPDPDLVTFWLADRIDERGWGLEGDTFTVMDGLRELGDDVWFNLGDRDLALCLRRARRLAEGARLTETLAEAATALGVTARVLPPSDDPIRTRVRTAEGWWPFQEFMIRRLRQEPPPVVEDVAFDGADRAVATDEALEALRTASAIVIGPSNPVISIGPILAVPAIRQAIRDARANGVPVVAVAPFVAGEVIKGPTRAFLDWAGVEADARGVARLYEDLLDGLVTDEAGPAIDGLELLRTDTLLADPAARRQVAGEVLDFCERLAARRGSAA
ncbi:2-phospho-L-lactate transferase [Patulibacter defluvii]|uniref:2-phospho-L-lactate transferase n=1 Tax=Patulibacter defluvii TaxID=3095358 RepID=UPI002A7597BF|nr:2-phospho-L-lactate transferase [Patulibacter sp. DM4]